MVSYNSPFGYTTASSKRIMAVEIKWLKDSHVVIGQFSDHVTTDDIHTASSQVDKVFHQRPGTHAITDLTDVTTFPASLIKVQGALTAPPEDRGWMLMVIPEGNPLLQFVGTYAGHLRARHGRFRSFRTLQAAVEFLQDHDPDISLTL